MTQELKTVQKFRVKSANAKDWKALVSVMEVLVAEATFTIDQEGVKLRAMDPSHIAMIEDEKITREQESRQIVEVTVKQRRRRKQ